MLDLLIHLDQQLFVLINSKWTSPWADQFFPFITDMHKSPIFNIIFIPALIGFFINKKGIKKGLLVFLFCAISIASSDLIGNWGFKKTIQRLRPAETQGLEVQVRSSFGGYSFVSNHSANMFNLATFISVIYPPIRIPVYSVAFLIGYSRVYNGVHFPADVLIGALLGCIVGSVFTKFCFFTLKKIDT
jgi:undecaprenyl-diphosphatase